MTVIAAEIEHPVAEIFDHGPAREITPHRAFVLNQFEAARDGYAAQEVLREDHRSFEKSALSRLRFPNGDQPCFPW
jgi:hypothetical protein